MNRRHIIKRIVLELQGPSQELINEVEARLREAIHEIVVPKLDQYCDELNDSDTVLYIDQLSVDLGAIRVSRPQEDIRNKIDVSFQRKEKIKINRAPVELRPEISDLEIILHFLDNGLLPWRASAHAKLSTLLSNVLGKDPEAATAIRRKIRGSSSAFQRFVWHITDEQLFSFFRQTLEPRTGWLLIQDLKTVWDKNVLIPPRNRKFHFWKIVTETLMKGEEDFLKSFLVRWSGVQNVSIFSLVHLLDRFVKKYEQDHGVKPLFTPMIPQILHDEVRMDLFSSVMQREIARLFDPPRNSSPRRSDVLQWQIRFLRFVVRHLSSFPAQQQADVAGAMQHFLTTIPVRDKGITSESPGTTGRTYQLDLKALDTLLQDNCEDHGFGYHSVRETLREFISKQGRFSSLEQFLFFLNKLSEVIQAFPASTMKNALKEYVSRLKKKASIQLQAMRKTLYGQLTSCLLQLEKEIAKPSVYREGEIGQIAGELHKLIRRIPSTIFPAEKRSAYQDLLQALERSVVLPVEETYDAVFQKVKELEEPAQDHSRQQQKPGNSEDDIYIRNAGLVLIAPFIRHLFEKLGYVQEGLFTNTHTVERAIVLLQYIVSPEDAEVNEYDLPLNKVLCGMGIATPVDLSKTLSADEKCEAEKMIESILQQEPVFRNISPEGFRSAFLKREGVLRTYGHHMMLKVSRETFDIVLDKVPWPYHVVRFNWMNHPLMIEW